MSALRKVCVVGAGGRMGRAIVRLAREGGLEIALAVDPGSAGKDAGELAGIGAIGAIVAPSLEGLAASGAQAVIELASPAATVASARACAAAKVPLVSGTTGLDDAAKAALDDAAKATAVLWEPNMSVGVHVLSALVARAVALLGPGYDVEIVEAHHGRKVDAPSGTAARLAEVARAARASETTMVYGREGRPGARNPSEIGVHAVRGGDVIGDHTVMLLGQGERLELSHKASSRDLFAAGALRAAAALVGRAPGRYGMTDVLGL